MANDTLARLHDMLVAKLSPFFGTVYFSQERWDWWDLRGGGGGKSCEKMALGGGHSKK